MKKHERILEFDVARSLSMLWIVTVWHFVGYIGWFSGRFGDFTLSRMSLVTSYSLSAFMFISSFCLAQRNKIDSAGDLWSFYKKRLLRILPLLLLSLLTFPDSQYPKHMVIGKVFALLGLSSFIPETIVKRVPTIWFASMIISFYALFPLFIAIKRWKLRTIALCIVEVLFIGGWRFFEWDIRLWQLFPSFSLGIVASSLAWERIKKVGLLFAIPAIIALFIGFEFKLSSPFFALSGASFILWISGRLTHFRNLSSLFSKIGYISLCAYLFHRQVYALFINAMWISTVRQIRALQLMFFCIPVIFVVAYLLQHTYDSIIRGTFTSRAPDLDSQKRHEH